MNPATIEKQTFSFDELSEATKAKARDWFRQGTFDDSWWQSVFEDATRIGALLGIRILRNREGIAIHFRGFGIQGQGCCYSGDLVVHDLKGAVEKIKAETNGTDAKLNDLAIQAETLYGLIVRDELLRKFTHYYDDHPDTTGHMVDWDIDCDGSSLSTYVLSGDDTPPFDDEMHALLEGFAAWIFTQLKAEYDYLCSDEYAEEGIRANEYLFDEFGSII